MTLSNSTIKYITTFLNRIKNQISNEIIKHDAKTGSSSAKGHVQAGTNAGYADVTNGAVGTDDGKYARADHQHSLSSEYASASHYHGNISPGGAVESTSYGIADKIVGQKGSSTTMSFFYKLSSNLTVNSSSLVNIGTGNDATQSEINSAVDNKFGTLSAVSTSGSYNDLSNKPTLSSLSTSNGELSINDVNGLSDILDAGFKTYVVSDFDIDNITNVSGINTTDDGFGQSFFYAIMCSNGNGTNALRIRKEFPNLENDLEENTIYFVYDTRGFYYEFIVIFDNNNPVFSEYLGSTHIELPEIIDNLITDDDDAVLSASMGKQLQDNKIDTAGTGLSKSGTTLNHSNSVTALTTSSLKKIKHDTQGHITGTDAVSGTDLPAHTNSTASSIGQATALVFGHAKATSSAPVDINLSSSAVGTDNGLYARGDHKHKHPSGTAKTGNPSTNQAPGFGDSFQITQFTSNATGHISGASDKTITIPSTTATASTNGLMTSTDKSKLDGMTTKSLTLTYTNGTTETINVYVQNS